MSEKVKKYFLWLCIFLYSVVILWRFATYRMITMWLWFIQSLRYSKHTFQKLYFTGKEKYSFFSTIDHTILKWSEIMRNFLEFSALLLLRSISSFLGCIGGAGQSFSNFVYSRMFIDKNCLKYAKIVVLFFIPWTKK